jgi:hypothetical protein
MNERIGKLAEQADDYAEQTVHYYQGQFDGLTWEGKIKQTRDTKFAELIVRECMRMCDVAAVGYDTHNHIKEANGCCSAKEYIEEHFGVKE